MPRRRAHAPLRVLLNNRPVGRVNKAATGTIDFQYEPAWLDWEHAMPVSLSLPLREDAYRGAAVTAVFDNLLPDSDTLRRRVAEKVARLGPISIACWRPSGAIAWARCRSWGSTRMRPMVRAARSQVSW